MDTALKKLKVVELKQILRDNGLRVGGTKSELIARIYENNIIYENDIKISKPYIHKGKMKWSAYTVSELKQALNDFGLPLSGKKEMLVKRLEDTGLDDIAASDYYAAEIAKVSPVKKKSAKPIKVKKDVEYIPLVDTLKILEPVDKGIGIKRSVRPKEIAKVSPVKKQVIEKVPNIKRHPFYTYYLEDLKLVLKELNLPTDGLKEAIVARLIEHFKNKPIKWSIEKINSIKAPFHSDIKFTSPKDDLYRTYHYDNGYTTIPVLQNISKYEYNLPTTGSKPQLIDRIIAYEIKNGITRAENWWKKNAQKYRVFNP